MWEDDKNNYEKDSNYNQLESTLLSKRFGWQASPEDLLAMLHFFYMALKHNGEGYVYCTANLPQKVKDKLFAIVTALDQHLYIDVTPYPGFADLIEYGEPSDQLITIEDLNKAFDIEEEISVYQAITHNNLIARSENFVMPNPMLQVWINAFIRKLNTSFTVTNVNLCKAYLSVVLPKAVAFSL